MVDGAVDATGEAVSRLRGLVGRGAERGLELSIRSAAAILIRNTCRECECRASEAVNSAGERRIIEARLRGGRGESQQRRRGKQRRDVRAETAAACVWLRLGPGISPSFEHPPLSYLCVRIRAALLCSFDNGLSLISSRVCVLDVLRSSLSGYPRTSISQDEIPQHGHHQHRGYHRKGDQRPTNSYTSDSPDCRTHCLSAAPPLPIADFPPATLVLFGRGSPALTSLALPDILSFTETANRTKGKPGPRVLSLSLAPAFAPLAAARWRLAAVRTPHSPTSSSPPSTLKQPQRAPPLVGRCVFSTSPSCCASNTQSLLANVFILFDVVSIPCGSTEYLPRIVCTKACLRIYANIQHGT